MAAFIIRPSLNLKSSKQYSCSKNCANRDKRTIYPCYRLPYFRWAFQLILKSVTFSTIPLIWTLKASRILRKVFLAIAAFAPFSWMLWIGTSFKVHFKLLKRIRYEKEKGGSKRCYSIVKVNPYLRMLPVSNGYNRVHFRKRTSNACGTRLHSVSSSRRA